MDRVRLETFIKVNKLNRLIKGPLTMNYKIMNKVLY